MAKPSKAVLSLSTSLVLVKSARLAAAADVLLNAVAVAVVVTAAEIAVAVAAIAVTVATVVAATKASL